MTTSPAEHIHKHTDKHTHTRTHTELLFYYQSHQLTAETGHLSTGCNSYMQHPHTKKQHFVSVWCSGYYKGCSQEKICVCHSGDSDCGRVCGGGGGGGGGGRAPRWYWPLWWRKPGSPSLHESPTHFRTTAQRMKTHPKTHTRTHKNTPKKALMCLVSHVPTPPRTHTHTHMHADTHIVLSDAKGRSLFQATNVLPYLALFVCCVHTECTFMTAENDKSSSAERLLFQS